MKFGRGGVEKPVQNPSIILEMMNGMGTLVTKKDRDCVFDAETISNRVFQIMHGAVLLYNDRREDGTLIGGCVALPGDILGYGQEEKYRWTAMAIEPSTLRAISKSFFNTHVRKVGSLSLDLAAIMGNQNQRSMEFAAILNRKSSEACVAAFILWFLEHSAKKTGGTRTDYRFGQQMTADILGFKRETVNRIMGQMTKDHLIADSASSEKRPLRILNVEGLKKLANE